MTSRRAGVLTLLVASFVQGLLSSAFPASAAVLRGRGLGDAAYGSLFVPQVALASLGALGGGLLVARLGARRAFALGFAVMGASQAALLAVVLVRPEWVYPVGLLGASLLGLGAGLAAGPLSAFPQMLFPATSESAVVALHTVVGLGLAASPLLAGLALGAGAWPVFPVALLAASTVLAVVVDKEDLPEPERRRGTGPVRRPLGDVALWLYLAVAALYGMAEGVFGYWAVPFLVEERGLDPAPAGFALAAFWGALSVGRVIVAVLVARVRPGPVLPLLAGLMAGAALLVPYARGTGGAVLVFALGGLGCSAVFPLALGLAGRRLSDHRAWVSAVLFAALCAGLGIGSLGPGLLRSEMTLAGIYRLASLPPALAALLAFVALGRRTSSGNHRPGDPGPSAPWTDEKSTVESAGGVAPRAATPPAPRQPHEHAGATDAGTRSPAVTKRGR